jgi:hypothetical protein
VVGSIRTISPYTTAKVTMNDTTKIFISSLQ